MNVFISWSGVRSEKVAAALHRYLPQMINAVEPWLSSTDVEAGARWGADIACKLQASSVGIICLTSANLDAPWIHFEAGALAKTLTSTFVCPYLLDIKPSEVTGPLSQFQSMQADENGTRRLVETLNRALDKPRKTEDLTDAFAVWWPKLKETLEAISKDETPPKRRSERDMLEELLELVRSQARGIRLPTPFLLPSTAATAMDLVKQMLPGATSRIGEFAGQPVIIFSYNGREQTVPFSRDLSLTDLDRVLIRLKQPSPPGAALSDSTDDSAPDD
ncbi:MAG TPA: TIR domain-containing protein [Bryobacteraceae bacterium]|nr:TIR domain-containing protein [Bryobacteraceae bacterium]